MWMPGDTGRREGDEFMTKRLSELMLLAIAVVPCTPKLLAWLHLYLPTFYYLWGGKH
jgi:hypothetical protein